MWIFRYLDRKTERKEIKSERQIEETRGQR